MNGNNRPAAYRPFHLFQAVAQVAHKVTQPNMGMFLGPGTLRAKAVTAFAQTAIHWATSPRK